ncbi:MAG TPA: glycosyl hydrolase family 28 protein [Pyrinomonadaceae bacterium]
MTNRREFIKQFLVGGAAALVTTSLASAETVSRVINGSLGSYSSPDDAWAQVPLILKRIKPPVFPKRDFSVTRYGAVGDGKKDCTESFSKAIDACNKAGGGRVVVPAGLFLTGAIHLKSNVNLYVSRDATIKFNPDPAKYLPLVFTRFEGTECMNFSPLIYAFEQENLAVTGEGTLDGSASDENWWAWNRRGADGSEAPARASIRKLLDYGERNVPVSERVFGQGEKLRPNFIQPYRCKNILIENLHIINSPMWEIHPVLSTNITVRGIKIKSHGPNNDGCDPESCTDVLIEDCEFDTGDDCIAIKSGRNNDGRRVNVPSQNLIVRGCRMKDGHGGVTIGSEISGGVRNVFAENCQMDSPNLDYALRVKNNAMRGGLLENLYFRNIEVGQVRLAVITVDFNYEEGEKGKFTPVVRNFVVDDLKSAKSARALDVQGFKQAPVYDMKLTNCTFDNVAQSNIVKNVQGLTFTNVRINGKLVENIASAAKIKIVLAGDSTVTDKDGWGKGFKEHLDENIECVNMAQGGRSSRSYLNEGWWQKVLALHGDYILIQFGHNDMPGKGPERETDPQTSYREFMTRYVDEARAAGAKPILVTSLTRRRFKNGKIDSDLFPYTDAVKRIAAEKRVPLIDLHRLSIELIDSMGQKESDALGKMKPDGSGMDYTHLGDKGSELIGKLVADELRRVEPELAAHIK